MLPFSRSLDCIGAATPRGTFKAAMSSHSFNARGRHYWRRGFSDRAPAGGYEGLNETDAFVSGDSHVSDARTANYGHRQGYAQQQQLRPWRPSPPPLRAGPPRKSADHRNWICAASQPPPDRERFKVLSYNILADYLALDHQPNLYFHIPNHILAWEWRKRRLFIEFGLWSPDIMCLQEVDRFCDLEGELAIRGYTGIWKMRTGNAVDGCAIFWRTNRFQLRHEEHIEFSKLGLRDNVAQICVLESKMPCLAENVPAALPASYNQSSGANQVIVCNTHVLYNPKRGEIKLGQVRVLLDRAFTVSRAWSDAPVIVCGDFNSKPMSPLYKFIATQKLNLSGLTREQISGQQFATVHIRPNSGCGSYGPQPFSRYASESTFCAQEGYYKTRPDNRHNLGITSPIEKSPVNLYPDVQQNTDAQMPSGATGIKLGVAEIFSHQGGEVSSTFSKIAIMPHGASEFFSQQSIINVNREAEKNREEAQKNILNEPCSEDHKDSPGSDNLANEIKLTSPSCMDNSTASPLHNNVNFHSFQIDSNNVDDTLSEEKPFTSCASLEVPMVENTDNSFTGSAVAEKVGFLTCHNSCKHDGLDLYNFDGSHVSDRMGVLSCIEDEKITDNMNSGGDSKQVASDNTLIEIPTLCGNLNKDAALENNQSSELSGLEENEESRSPELSGLEENADPNFFKELLGMEEEIQTMKDLNSPNVYLQEDSSFPLASAASNVERRFYNPYCWSPMEIEIASGKAKCTVVEHPLKLRSAYTDVEDYTGTKDSSREPQVTSYNQQFMGTVDYIWCSEDLHTVKVLDTIPKHVLQRTPGFPTQKWGSDHIALVCELAFSKSSQNK